MSTIAIEESLRTLCICKEIKIAAPVEVTFDAVLEELGPAGEMPDGKPMPMVIEAWPGGRWYRDLGDNAGHLWGHVQVIKPPTLLELCGPMFMSFPGVNHVQYRLTPEGGATRLTLTHRAMGLLPPEVQADCEQGWDFSLGRVREIAERLAQNQWRNGGGR